MREILEALGNYILLFIVLSLIWQLLFLTMIAVMMVALNRLNKIPFKFMLKGVLAYVGAFQIFMTGFYVVTIPFIGLGG